uniref:Uncharacterized protein n=1 Tax=Rhizophora mucronata TaxID=61149 RepID=A0A2P2NVT5_RHIMU
MSQLMTFSMYTNNIHAMDTKLLLRAIRYKYKTIEMHCQTPQCQCLV